MNEQDNQAQAEQLINVGQTLKNKGATRHDQYKEMDWFFGFQNNDDFSMKDSGSINRALYAHEGRQAVIDFAAGMHGNATNPTQRWFSFEVSKEDLAVPERKKWADDTEDKMYELMSETNFMQQIHEFYIQLGQFNTACMMSEADLKTGVRFRTRKMRDLYFAEASNGEVNMVYFYYTLTAKQMKEVWGNKIPERVQAMLDSNNVEDEVDLVHVVMPRKEGREDALDAKMMPWASYHITEEQPEIIEEGGYIELPYHIARFYKQDGDVYGIGPSFYLLPCMRQLNFYKTKDAENVEIQLNPPVIFPSDDYIIPDQVGPRTIIIGDEVSTGQAVRKLDIAGDPVIGERAIAREVEALQKGFFLDRFSTLQGITKELTATETAQLINESTRYLGPVVGRINTMLRGLLERTFRLYMEAGLLPVPPKGMTNYKIRFESFLTRSQRASELADLDAWLNRSAQIAQFKPDSLDNINADEIIRGTSDIHGIKQRYLNDPEVVDAERAARAEAAAQAQQLEQLAMLEGASGST